MTSRHGVGTCGVRGMREGAIGGFAAAPALLCLIMWRGDVNLWWLRAAITF